MLKLSEHYGRKSVYNMLVIIWKTKQLMKKHFY